MIRLGILSLLLFSTLAPAHEGRPHAQGQSAKQKQEALSSIARAKITAIAWEYDRTVKPIFVEKCIACHGQGSALPWYYPFPGARQLIDSDRTEAKRHLDMTKGFPFRGHGSIEEDLVAIKSSVVKGTMPPLRYRLLHWGAALTEEEKAVVILWTDRSVERLRTSGNASEEK